MHPFTQFLIKKGHISKDTLHVLKDDYQTTKSTPIYQLLEEKRLLSPKIIEKAFFDCYGVHFFEPSKMSLSKEDLLTKWPKQNALSHKAILFEIKEDCALVAFFDPHNLLKRDELQKVLHKKVIPYFMTKQVFSYVLDTFYKEKNDIFEINTEAIEFLDNIMSESIIKNASDIHFQSYKNYGLIRMRIDGILVPYQRVSLSLWSKIIARLKVQSDLDIAETRKPQFGRFHYFYAGRDIDCRISFHPIMNGENCVVRLLDKSKGLLSLKDLGFSDQQQIFLKNLAKEPQGMIVFTGPTGSGKTTSLYALLMEMDQERRNIMTLENPIEYDIEGIQQTEISQHLNFAQGVRSLLRQDPDVILIGEMRDEETAQMAIRASITGHLVLSTLHTVDAASVPNRLRDLGIPLDLLVSHLLCVVGQRLVRRLCPQCKKAEDHTQHFIPCGCCHCFDSGYQGRVCINEFFLMTDESRDLIEKKASLQTIRGHIDHTFHMDAIDKVAKGVTSQEEVDRVLGKYL